MPSNVWRIESRNGIRYLYKGLVEWMCDDFQRRTVMDYYASLAHGRTLVGGLGLGLLTEACQKNDNVSEVITVERDKTLIHFVLLAPNLFDNGTFSKGLWPGFNLIHDDAWLQTQRGPWDTIILDLWPDHAKPDEDFFERGARIRAFNPGVTLIIHGYPDLSDA